MVTVRSLSSLFIALLAYSIYKDYTNKAKDSSEHSQTNSIDLRAYNTAKLIGDAFGLHYYPLGINSITEDEKTAIKLFNDNADIQHLIAQKYTELYNRYLLTDFKRYVSLSQYRTLLIKPNF